MLIINNQHIALFSSFEESKINDESSILKTENQTNNNY